MSAPFFRDVTFPSHAQDHAARERFLLDTHAERRADATPRPSASVWLRSVVARARKAF